MNSKINQDIYAYLKLKESIIADESVVFQFSYAPHNNFPGIRLICIPFSDWLKENCSNLRKVQLTQAQNFGSKQRQKIAICCEQCTLLHKIKCMHVKPKRLGRKLYGSKSIWMMNVSKREERSIGRPKKKKAEEIEILSTKTKRKKKQTNNQHNFSKCMLLTIHHGKWFM